MSTNANSAQLDKVYNTALTQALADGLSRRKAEDTARQAVLDWFLASRG